MNMFQPGGYNSPPVPPDVGYNYKIMDPLQILQLFAIGYRQRWKGFDYDSVL